MQGRHKLRCKALKNNMAKDRCKNHVFGHACYNVFVN